MKVFFLPKVADLLEGLDREDRSRVDRTREFFEKYGFSIGPKYIKKVANCGLWELRIGKMRLFLCIRGGSAVDVNLIHKNPKG